MSLLLWYPFVKGNYKNQGLLDVETSMLGTIDYEDGKLGKAVRIGNGTQVVNGVQINTNLVEEFGDEYSCSVWVKPTGSHVHYEGAILSSGNWNNKKWAFGIGQNNTTIDPLGPGYGYKLACEIPVNEWTHLVSTVKNNIATVYKNGELVGTIDFGSLVLESNSVNTTIGRETYANGYFSFNGCIQDMRIYNHCLSRREIKEISKGLVLHYPLSSGGGENLCVNSNNITTSNFVLARSTADGGTITMTPTTSASYAKYKASNLLYSDYKNKTYTLSFYVRRMGSENESYTDKELRIYIGLNIPSRINQVISSSYDKYILLDSLTDIPNDWEYHSVTCAVPDDLKSGKDDAIADTSMVTFEFVNSASGTPIQIKSIKFEVGDKATPWTPNPADDEYAAMGYDDPIEYDVSGYGNNGTVSGVVYSADTARYSVSTSFDGANDYINIGSDVGHLFDGSPFSICFWIKSMENTTRGIIFSGYGLPSTSNFFSLEINSSSPTYCNNNLRFDWKSNPDIYSSNDMIPYNQWAHIAVTYDGSNTVSMYKNGQLFSTKSSPLLSIDFGNNYYLGKDNRTGTTAFNGLMSDFRIYATCLSADDIKALYQIPISLSSDGTLFAGEYVEG